MKRKLNEEDVPTPVEEGSSEKPEEALPTKSASPTFESFGLDNRILQAIANEDFRKPTQVQARAIPLALEGKDILGIVAYGPLDIFTD